MFRVTSPLRQLSSVRSSLPEAIKGADKPVSVSRATCRSSFLFSGSTWPASEGAGGLPDDISSWGLLAGEGGSDLPCWALLCYTYTIALARDRARGSQCGMKGMRPFPKWWASYGLFQGQLEPGGLRPFRGFRFFRGNIQGQLEPGGSGPRQGFFLFVYQESDVLYLYQNLTSLLTSGNSQLSCSPQKNKWLARRFFSTRHLEPILIFKLATTRWFTIPLMVNIKSIGEIRSQLILKRLFFDE